MGVGVGVVQVGQTQQCSGLLLALHRYTQKLLLVMLKGPYGMLGTEPRLAVYKCLLTYCLSSNIFVKSFVCMSVKSLIIVSNFLWQFKSLEGNFPFELFIGIVFT